MSKKLSVRDRALLAVKSHPDASAPIDAATMQNTDRNVTLVRAKTGPGAMLTHLAKESEVQKENQALKDELKVWADSLPVKRLDAAVVKPSRWANRLEGSFESEEFEQLKREIESAGGNVQPIKVRPIAASDPQEYEIVYGHRRHRACLVLGLPVAAQIEPLTERALFIEMERENRQRADLRPYEQGLMYRRALDAGLFSSLRMLANEIGEDPGKVSKALALARLPDEVIHAFPSPLDLQFRWSKPLSDACEKDPQLLLKRARSIKTGDQTLSAARVLDVLLGVSEEGVEPFNTPQKSVDVRANGKRVATVKLAATGQVNVTFEPHVVKSKDLKRLAEVLQTFVVAAE